MSYPINYPTPQGANVQILYKTDDWVKPQGASFVWFTLIGAGGTYGVSGGGSGAVTNFMCPAFLIPDVLRVNIGIGGTQATPTGTATTLVYQEKDGTGYTLLTASFGRSDGIAGAAMTANYFTAMGFFQSVAGQAGSTTSISASNTTFLSGGGTGGYTVTANYGYSTNQNGMFQLQPIIVGLGAASSTSGFAGIGCGGSQNGNGGDGLAVIITW